MGSLAKQLRVLTYIGLILVVTGALAGGGGDVELRSGVVRSAPHEEPSGESGGDGPERWIVHLDRAPGWHEKGAIEMAGARVIAPLPGQAYLVSIPADRAAALSGLPELDWATRYLPQDKIAPEIATVGASEGDVIVFLQLFADADPETVAAELEADGLTVTGVGSGSRFDRLVLRMSSDEVEAHRDALAARNDVFWIGRRHRR